MQGKLTPIKLPPGLYRNGTRYEASARWYEGNLVRFIDGTIRPIGGWRSVEDDSDGTVWAATGLARGAISWRGATGSVRIGLGTHRRLYALVEGTLADITPSGFVEGAADSSFSSGTGVYGSGVYGAGPYGTGSLAGVLIEADTWQLDNFGDYLVGVHSGDGKLYVWQGVLTTLAAVASGAPVNNRGVVATNERFLVALGAGDNVRQVQWASQETIDTWTPAANNTAGDRELVTKGRIMAGRRTKTENLIWTDADLHRMRYIGGVLVYGFEQAGDACGLLAPNAVSIVESKAFWMGRDNFFMYDGFVRPLPSEVRDYVFGDFNAAQAAKVWSMSVSKYGEVWWFYPSAASSEIDRYVVFNYLEGHWTFGQLDRLAGFDSGASTYPFMWEPAYAAKGTLTSTGVNVSNGDTVTIGGKTYTFQTVLTNVDGNVLIGANAAASLANLKAAINLEAGAGTTYATATTVHTTVVADSVTATTLLVRAKASGSGGNSIASTEVAVTLSWGGATLASGGTASGIVVSDVFEHEIGDDRGSEVPYLESGPFEIAEGDRIMNIHGLIPDEKTLGDVELTMFTSFFPTQAETENGPYTLAAPTDLRLSARQVRLRIDQVRETDWRVGTQRLALTPAGKR